MAIRRSCLSSSIPEKKNNKRIERETYKELKIGNNDLSGPIKLSQLKNSMNKNQSIVLDSYNNLHVCETKKTVNYTHTDIEHSTTKYPLIKQSDNSYKIDYNNGRKSNKKISQNVQHEDITIR